jgi:hypothetical protein
MKFKIKKFYWQYDDGGRAAAGYKTPANCTVRAISIATGLSHDETVAQLRTWARNERPSVKCHRSSSRHGFRRTTYHPLLSALGAKWIAGPLRLDDLPPRGRYVVSVRKHMTAIVDGVIRDAFDPREFAVRRNGRWRIESKRTVYGYYKIANPCTATGRSPRR